MFRIAPRKISTFSYLAKIAVGRFFKDGGIVLKRNDKNISEFDISKLNKLASYISDSHTLKKQHDSLFDDKSLNLKQVWEQFKVKFTQAVMQN